jgi:hypothetical protein
MDTTKNPHELKRDTLIAVFNSSPEVFRFNHIKTTVDKKLLSDTEDTSDKMYITSPGGVFPVISIPVSEIMEKVGKKGFNSVNLNIKAYPPSTDPSGLPLPGLGNVITYNGHDPQMSALLLLETDSLTSFFEKRKAPDFQKSFITTYDSNSSSYNYANISNLIQNVVKANPDITDLRMSLVPVLLEVDEQSYSSFYFTNHYLYPSGVTLKKGDGDLEITIVATDLGKKN